MYTLKLKDGTCFDCSWCGESDDVLCAALPITIIEAAQTFSDADRVSVIVFDYTAGQDTFEGYTKLVGINMQDGLTIVQLKKEG